MHHSFYIFESRSIDVNKILLQLLLYYNILQKSVYQIPKF